MDVARTDSELADRIVALYQKGTPASELADRYKLPPGKVRRILKANKVPIRSQGRPTGWRKLSPEEIAHRRTVGLRSRTWEQYRKALGLPEDYNVRLDRRKGIEVVLACFKCGKNPSTTTGRVDGVIRQLCGKCS